MIISHRHKFIFIHIAKTGGSAAKVYFARFLGPRDLQLGAFLDTWEAGIRPNARAYYDLFSFRPLSFGKIRALAAGRRRLVTYMSKLQRDKYQRRLGVKPDHCGAETIRRYAPESWAQYPKACFVRNPFERMASYYLYKTKELTSPPTFSDMLSRVERKDYSERLVSHTVESWSKYTIDDKIVVDFIGRHECFDDDMKRLCASLGMCFDPTLLQFVKKAPSYNYRDLYGPGDKGRVERAFGPEIEHFGYRF